MKLTTVTNKPMNMINKAHQSKFLLKLKKVLMTPKSFRMKRKINLIPAYLNFPTRCYTFRTNKISKEKHYFTKTFYFKQELNVPTSFKYLCLS